MSIGLSFQLLKYSHATGEIGADIPWIHLSTNDLAVVVGGGDRKESPLTMRILQGTETLVALLPLTGSLFVKLTYLRNTSILPRMLTMPPARNFKRNTWATGSISHNCPYLASPKLPNWPCVTARIITSR